MVALFAEATLQVPNAVLTHHKSENAILATHKFFPDTLVLPFGLPSHGLPHFAGIVHAGQHAYS